MRAVRHTEGGITMVDVPEPDAPGRALRVASAGICGSDLHLLDLGPLPSTLECATCVVPRPVLDTLLLDTLRRHAPAVRAIVLDDPRERS